MARIDVNITKDAGRIVVSLRGDGARVSLGAHVRAASALEANLARAVASDEDFEAEFTVHGQLDVGAV